MTWTRVNKDDLPSPIAADDYLRLTTCAESGFWVSDAGWASSHSWWPGSGWGGTVVVDDDAQASIPEATRLIADHVATLRRQVGWFSVPLGHALPKIDGYAPTCVDEWCWMSATSLHNDAPVDADIVELDDVADAAEISEFALAINPSFEGDPGSGKSRLWLGYRENGKLLGCGTMNIFASGIPHLAGLVVDPSLRGQGLGREILMRLSLAAIAEYSVVTLGVHSHNDHAISLYQGLGYTSSHTFTTNFV